MATFILLTKLSSQALGSPRKRETIGRKWVPRSEKEVPGSEVGGPLCPSRPI